MATTHSIASESEWNAMSALWTNADSILITSSFTFSAQPTFQPTLNSGTFDGQYYTITFPATVISFTGLVALNGGTVDRVRVAGGDTGLSNSQAWIVTQNSIGTITDCTCDCNVKHVGGGICGNDFNGTISKCIMTGDVDNSSGGGIIGSMNENTIIQDCYYDTGTVSRGGGIVGRGSNSPSSTPTPIRRCYVGSSATIGDGSYTDMGGIAGNLSYNYSIEDCLCLSANVYVTPSAAGIQSAGAILGRFESFDSAGSGHVTVRRCYAVTGHIIGRVRMFDGKELNIEELYTAGATNSNSMIIAYIIDSASPGGGAAINITSSYTPGYTGTSPLYGLVRYNSTSPQDTTVTPTTSGLLSVINGSLGTGWSTSNWSVGGGSPAYPILDVFKTGVWDSTAYSAYDDTPSWTLDIVITVEQFPSTHVVDFSVQSTEYAYADDAGTGIGTGTGTGETWTLNSYAVPIGTGCNRVNISTHSHWDVEGMTTQNAIFPTAATDVVIYTIPATTTRYVAAYLGRIGNASVKIELSNNTLVRPSDTANYTFIQDGLGILVTVEGGTDVLYLLIDSLGTDIQGETLTFSWTGATETLGPQAVASDEAAPPSNCFGEDTLIETEQGPMRISTIKSGTNIVVKDSQGNNQLAKANIIRRFSPIMTKDVEMNRLKMRKDALAPGIPNEDIIISKDHLIYVPENIRDSLLCPKKDRYKQDCYAHENCDVCSPFPTPNGFAPILVRDIKKELLEYSPYPGTNWWHITLSQDDYPDGGAVVLSCGILGETHRTATSELVNNQGWILYK